ncbi:early transcribed membrane protein [Plasmodium chabaudi chabaudi]|uniref:Early transcribed membrane protein n=1 Tax=Plasmodium chabaudi chabaudi TaxID=31271 RepID=Q7Z1C7_PLACU|nr:early transcribed membrane protein [Plasmodium chabaudi chabaudi]AAN78104.1 PC15C [Plasmodium chabaudi chabaudi]SCL85716.1 early transcribed membrane protein [Plasmodium chabaudi chabaudi]VTZ69458.1 early transcribed membrane protein [Plasmodium chabaudi chabaudi]|eukprot:XP_731680.2 early transcribed membrane protein [Plasmodium chabaudi chabaudi]
MKLTKALYFIAFLLAINVLVPGSNNYVEAKPAKGNGNSLVNKIKNNKVAFLATVIGTLALAAAGTTFGVMHLKKKGKGKKSPVPNSGKPAPVADNKPAPKVDNKSKPSTPEPTTRSSPAPEPTRASPTPEPAKSRSSSPRLLLPEPSENPTIFSYNPNMYKKVN